MPMDAEERALLHTLSSDMAVVKDATSRIVRVLDGNGQPGLVSDHAALRAAFMSHMDEAAARDALIAKAAQQAPAPWKQNVVTWGSLLAGLSAFGSFAALIRVLTSTP